MNYLLTLTVLGALLMADADFRSDSSRGSQQPEATLNDLAWMTGSWIGTSHGVEMEEHWTAPKAAR